MRKKNNDVRDENIIIEQEDDEEEEKLLISKYMPHLFLFTILLFFCVFGITYSIYKGDSGEDSEIITDQIIFTYSDVDKVGNGILINNAMPIPDQMGKAMLGKNQYFDFYITSTTGNSKVFYQLLIDKDDSSTLSNKKVRIYLTKMLGSYEQELVLEDFSNLEVKNLNNKNYYVLYGKTLENGLENYSDSYRLRMWVDNEAVDYQNQRFSIKVDVHAEQVGE